MNKGVILFFCALFITILSIINLSIGPIISGKVGKKWGTKNCQNKIDGYDIKLEKTPNLDYKEREYEYEYPINQCKRTKAMHDMEYTSFIFNIFIGPFFVILGLFLLFEVKPDFIPKIGLIGLISGIVGFILTLVYIVYNGIVFTNYYDDEVSIVYKMDSDRSFAVYDGDNQFKCIFYDEKINKYALYAKFSDLNQKQYNYDKKLVHEQDTDDTPIPTGCKADPSDCENSYGYITPSGSGSCDKIYNENPAITDDSNKDKSDRFLAALILSLLICIGYIGLALFGFLLFKSPSEFSKIENKI